MKQFWLVIVAWLAFSGMAFAADSYTVTSGASLQITEHTQCRNVTNNHTSALSVFVPTRTLAEWSSFYNNPPAGVTAGICPGSQTYATPGTYSFTIPAHTTLTVTVYGAGGGGGGGGYYTGSSPSGGTGGQSSFNGAIIAAGGGGGTGGWSGGAAAGGAGGSSSGGTTNSTGPTGGTGNYGVQGAGAGGYDAIGTGGTGGWYYVGSYYGAGGGGAGGKSVRTYSSGTLTPGASVTVIVGSGGAGGAGYSVNGANGGDGRVVISWN